MGEVNDRNTLLYGIVHVEQQTNNEQHNPRLISNQIVEILLEIGFLFFRWLNSLSGRIEGNDHEKRQKDGQQIDRIAVPLLLINQ